MSTPDGPGTAVKSIPEIYFLVKGEGEDVLIHLRNLDTTRRVPSSRDNVQDNIAGKTTLANDFANEHQVHSKGGAQIRCKHQTVISNTDLLSASDKPFNRVVNPWSIRHIALSVVLIQRGTNMGEKKAKAEAKIGNGSGGI